MATGRTTRELGWFGAATLVHVVALAAAMSAREAVAPGRVSAVAQDVIDLEIAGGEVARTMPVSVAPRSADAPRAAAMSATASHASSLKAGDTGNVAVVATTVAARADRGAEETWSFRPEKAPDLLAQGQVAFARRDAPAPRMERESASGGIAEALAEEDLAQGLGRGGPIVSALEDVARTSDAPVRGMATFDVIVERSGSAEVHLASADSEFDAWSHLARAMSDAVANVAVRIPPGAGGLRVRVRLDARVQLPDGRDPRSLGAFARTWGLALADGSMVAKTVPSVTVGATGKVCGAALHVGVDGIAILGGCSPENIAAVPVRIVHGRELSELPM